MTLFTGVKVELTSGDVGIITGGFGDTGKFHVTFKKGYARKPGKSWKPKLFMKTRKFAFQKYRGIIQ